MNRAIFAFCVCILTANITFSQKQNFPKGPIVSLKAGYHFAENKSGTTPMPYDYSIPGGPTFEISGEMPTGKGWYPGIDFEYSLGSDAVYDVQTMGSVNRKVYIANVTGFIKKRFFMNRSSIFLLFGLGRGLVGEKYDSQFTDNEDAILSYTFKLGGEVAVASQLLLLIEGQYLGLGLPSSDAASRKNSLFMLKAGFGYVFK